MFIIVVLMLLREMNSGLCCTLPGHRLVARCGFQKASNVGQCSETASVLYCWLTVLFDDCRNQMMTLKYANKAEYGSKLSHHGKKAVSKVSGNKDCIMYMCIYLFEVSSSGLCAKFVSDFCQFCYETSNLLSLCM